MSEMGRDVRSAAFRACLSRFASGVTVVTYDAGAERRGITVNAFSSVSLEPPLVLVSIARRTHSHDLLAAMPFTVNVLRAGQEDVARAFAGVGAAGAVRWRDGAVGMSPRLDGALAFIACEPYRAYDGGDHTLYLGRVVDVGYGDGDALGYFCGRFMPVPRPAPSVPELPYDPFEMPYDAL
jgi:flavin reductase (DIM6/NTAB) family NADH-FMN oxidoreductase RutF